MAKITQTGARQSGLGVQAEPPLHHTQLEQPSFGLLHFLPQETIIVSCFEAEALGKL